jgi:hypothetical protein
MDWKGFAKIAVVVLLAWFVINWISSAISAAEYQPTDAGLTGNGWAPPLPYPGTIVTGWTVPWRGRRRGARPY